MRVAWARGSVTAQEVVEELSGHEWSPRTVKTLLSRLKTKGALSYELRGKAYVYRPAVRQAACVRQEAQSFADRVFGGAMAPLLAHFVTRAKLSRQEIAALKKTLAAKRR
jgi:BlaI family penicillinase repressor